MRQTCKNRSVALFVALLLGPVCAAPVHAEKNRWEENTALVSREGNETVVKAFKGGRELFRNTDPQLALEWAMTRARTTVVLPGQYVALDRIDIPRDGVTLIIDLLIAERPHEIIDMNGSHLDAKEIICIGEPDKLLCFTVAAGPRWTSRPAVPDRLDVWKTSILEEAQTAILKVDAPKLPDALPQFSVKATVEVTMPDGAKKEYTKEVQLDVR